MDTGIVSAEIERILIERVSVTKKEVFLTDMMWINVEVEVRKSFEILIADAKEEYFKSISSPKKRFEALLNIMQINTQYHQAESCFYKIAFQRKKIGRGIIVDDEFVTFSYDGPTIYLKVKKWVEDAECCYYKKNIAYTLSIKDDKITYDVSNVFGRVDCKVLFRFLNFS